jgi:hypothetical protein
MRTEMKHCSLGQYCLLVSGNQPNQNLTQPKIHTRNKGKFLHKRIRSGAITEWKENLVTGPPTAAAHNDQQRKIMAQEKSPWLMDRGLGQGTEFLCGKKINKQAMKIMSFPCRTNKNESATDTRRAEREERPRHEKENQTGSTASGLGDRDLDLSGNGKWGDRDLDLSGNGKWQRAANQKPVAQPNGGC